MPTDPQTEQSPLPLKPPLAHHKVFSPTTKKELPQGKFNPKIVYKIGSENIDKPYGVPSNGRIITKSLLNKYHHDIVRFLKHELGLTTAEREGIIRLLRLSASYNYVYPKAEWIAEQLGCSKRTFWRAIAKLKEMGLITVINRFLVREEAQISNLYILRKLCIAIARFLRDRSARFYQNWLQPLLEMPIRTFWRALKKWPWTIGPAAT